MKTVFIIAAVLSAHFCAAQNTKSNYLSLNMPPIAATAIELGYQTNFRANFTCEAYLGYLINCRQNSPRKIGSLNDLDKKSGFFLKLGAHYNFRKDLKKFAPFVGVSLVNALAMEQGKRYLSFFDYSSALEFKSNTYNLGLSGLIGITSPAHKQLNVDLGLQIGTLIVDNLVDFHSYMPGMGLDYGGGWRPQLILRLNYKL